jgi:hypothetical protein
MSEPILRAKVRVSLNSPLSKPPFQGCKVSPIPSKALSWLPICRPRTVSASVTFVRPNLRAFCMKACFSIWHELMQEAGF